MVFTEVVVGWWCGSSEGGEEGGFGALIRYISTIYTYTGRSDAIAAMIV